MPEDKNDFMEGRIEYRSFTLRKPAEMPADVAFLNPWHDGYAAFSRGEARLSAIGDPAAAHLWEDRVENMPGKEGFLMEMDLWRENGGGVYEELSLEREDNGFFCQHWRLETSPSDRANCYFRKAKIYPRRVLGGRPGLFQDGELGAWECILPEHRLHFFITTGRPS